MPAAARAIIVAGAVHLRDAVGAPHRERSLAPRLHEGRHERVPRVAHWVAVEAGMRSNAPTWLAHACARSQVRGLFERRPPSRWVRSSTSGRSGASRRTSPPRTQAAAADVRRDSGPNKIHNSAIHCAPARASAPSAAAANTLHGGLQQQQPLAGVIEAAHGYAVPRRVPRWPSPSRSRETCHLRPRLLGDAEGRRARGLARNENRVAVLQPEKKGLGILKLLEVFDAAGYRGVLASLAPFLGLRSKLSLVTSQPNLKTQSPQSCTLKYVLPAYDTLRHRNGMRLG